MATENGAYLVGSNLVLKAGSGGKIVLDPSSFFSGTAVKTHNLYSGSQFQIVTGAVSTADATVTKVLGVPVAQNHSAGLFCLVHGVQDDWSDALTAIVTAAGTRTTGNVGVEGTASITIVESDAATNITFAANTTTQELEVRVTGVAAENWIWTAYCIYSTIGTAA